MLDLGITVLWFSKEKYLPGNNLPEHKHTFFHYIYVLDGTANLNVNGKAYKAQSDDFYLIHCGLGHSLEVIDDYGIQTIEIKFSVNNDTLSSDIQKLETKIKYNDLSTRHILESFLNEGIKMEAYYNDLINLRFLEMLLRMLRNYADNPNNTSKNSKALIPCDIPDEDNNYELYMKKVADYIENNLVAKIELEDLAKIANMSKYYFCRNFKRNFRLSPMRYLNQMRLEKAKELMMYSNLNVSQIAYNVGFEDTQYFSRFFRQCEGISPSEYIHKNKPNLYFYLTESKEQLNVISTNI